MAENIYAGHTGLNVLITFDNAEGDLSAEALQVFMRTPALNVLEAEADERDPDGEVVEVTDVTIQDLGAGLVRAVLPELADAGTYRVWGVLTVGTEVSESTETTIFVRQRKTPTS